MEQTATAINFKPLTLRILPPICEIPLTNSNKVALVDAKYYDLLLTVSNWYCTIGSVRSTRSFNNNNQICMHRYIMLLEGKLDENLMIDHIDRNPLNNTVSNLRIANNQENNRNKGKRKGTTSKYIGVTWSKRDLKWRACIGHNYKVKHLGLFDNEEDAAYAYDNALREAEIDENFKVYNFNQIMVIPQKSKRTKKRNTTSKYIGVSMNQNGKWKAQIRHNYKVNYLGQYENEEEAARAYDKALEQIPIDEATKLYNFC